MGKLRDDNVTSLDFAEFAAEIMRSVVQQDWPVATAGITADEPSIVGIQSYPATNDRPSMFIGYGPTFGVAFIGGVTNASLALKFWQGFFDFTPLPVNTARRNTFTDSIADFVVAEMTRLGVGVGALKVAVGHSFGGTVAQVVATRAQFLGGTSRGYYCTFGSPKFVRGADATVIGSVPGVRWMNDADPVPLFPFTINDSLLTLLLLSPLLQRQFAEFVQARGGMTIFSDGTTEPTVLPPNATTGEILSFITWIFGQDASVASPHAISEYATRLHTAASAARNPLQALRVSTEQEAPATVSSRYYTQQQQRIATAVSRVQAQQNEPVTLVPRVRLFTYERQGRIWVINFNGSSVGLTSDKRTARSLCRQWNTALRHLQSTAFISTENLTQQFTQYIAAASDPTSGFTPTMNATLPV